MRYPNLSEERKLWRKGYKRVMGFDEAGRGSLAGPILSAVVMIENSKSRPLKIEISKFRDSKKLSPKAREKLYKILTTHPQIKWGIGKVSAKVIDKINIQEATKLAMGKALNNLKLKTQNFRPDYLILDGETKLDLRIPQKLIVKADEKVFSCAAASILAKVTRDRIMGRYHKKYPQYGFAQNKGYGTKFHLNMLKKYGPSVVHRLTFAPVKNATKIGRDNKFIILI